MHLAKIGLVPKVYEEVFSGTVTISLESRLRESTANFTTTLQLYSDR